MILLKVVVHYYLYVVPEDATWIGSQLRFYTFTSIENENKKQMQSIERLHAWT